MEVIADNDPTPVWELDIRRDHRKSVVFTVRPQDIFHRRIYKIALKVSNIRGNLFDFPPPNNQGWGYADAFDPDVFIFMEHNAPPGLMVPQGAN